MLSRNFMLPPATFPCVIQSWPSILMEWNCERDFRATDKSRLTEVEPALGNILESVTYRGPNCIPCLSKLNLIAHESVERHDAATACVEYGVEARTAGVVVCGLFVAYPDTHCAEYVLLVIGVRP